MAEIAKDQAVVLCAGFVGQVVAKNKGYFVSADIRDARSDHERAESALAAAGLPVELQQYRDTARSIVLREWWAVEDIAMYLQTSKKAASITVYEMIDEMYWPGGLA